MKIHGYATGFVDFPNKFAVTLFLTGCNLNCPYCYNRAVCTEDAEMPLEYVDAAIEAAESVMKQDKMGVVFSGGEPTINTDFQRLVDRFSDEGRPLALHTNGLQWFEDDFESIVLSLKTSHDGIPHKGLYLRQMRKVLERPYAAAEYKELRVVDAQLGREERGDLMTELADCATENGWHINIVEQL